MTLQIKKIVLYNKEGKIRTLDFEPGKVNIITGKSATGKSAIISIIDYCLGRSTFKVPVGKIQDNVAWYALLLTYENNEIFIAKPTPKELAKSQRNAYFEINNKIDIPKIDDLILNSNDETIDKELSALIGISENIHIPNEKRSSADLSASLKKSKYYLFQNQNLIANKDVLFYRQTEVGIPQAIKDTLPYFLGTVDEQQIYILEKLRGKKRELKINKRKLQEDEAIVANNLDRGMSLITEAKRLGLLDQSIQPHDPDQILYYLKNTLNWKPQRYDLVLQDDKITKLQLKIEELEFQLGEINHKIVAANNYKEKTNRYENEAKAQLERLESINLIETVEDNKKINKCPFCSSNIDDPNISYNFITTSLNNLNDGLKFAVIKQPQISKYVENLEINRQAIRDEIKDFQSTINTLINSQENTQKLRDNNARAAKTIGRISLYVESVEFLDENEELKQKIKILNSEIKSLEDSISDESKEEKLSSKLGYISFKMSEWAKTLNLEFKEYDHRIDINKLTVVADRMNSPIYMEDMGSGENWLGCHLIALFGLHYFFIKNKRPVPGFLVLDQPAQGYFSDNNEIYKTMSGIKGEIDTYVSDVDVVKRMFDFIFDIVEELSPDLQVIITEHAYLDSERFQNALIEEPWRGNKALIPFDWYD